MLKPQTGRMSRTCPSERPKPPKIIPVQQTGSPQKPAQGVLTQGDAGLQQAGAVQREAGCGHRGVGEHRLRHGHGGAGTDGAGRDRADRRHHHRGHGRPAGVLVVRQVHPLAEAGPRRLAGSEVVVHGQQALSQALPAAERQPAPRSPPPGGRESCHGSVVVVTDKILSLTQLRGSS